MPIYEYECGKGHKTERFFRIKERKKFIECPECKERAKRAVTRHSAFESAPKWINDEVRGSLQDLSVPGTIPITSRRQLNEHLKMNNLVCKG
jgi:putative FmdB family regulatory protein